MLLLKVFSARILILMFLLVILFSSLYMLMKLQDEEDSRVDCSLCRTMGFASVGKYLNIQDEVDDSVMATFGAPIFVKQFTVVDDGESVLYQDQFVLKGLMELRSIQKSTKNIFFVESSCVLGVGENQGVEFRLDAGQACGVESAARANPDRPVYVLHSCPLAEDFALRVPEHARGLMDLHNVYIVALDVAELSKGWSHPLRSSSASLGLLALWQFGGTYCDLDTLVLRPLRPLGTNYVGFRDDNLLVGNVMLNFEPLGYGHTVATSMLQDLSKIPSEDVWEKEMPYLTQTVIDQCNKMPISREDCNKLTIYDSTVLFTVGLNVTMFLKENLANDFVDRIKTTAYTIHYFSRLHSFTEDQKPAQAFLSLTTEFCPDVYKRSSGTF